MFKPRIVITGWLGIILLLCGLVLSACGTPTPSYRTRTAQARASQMTQAMGTVIANLTASPRTPTPTRTIYVSRTPTSTRTEIPTTVRTPTRTATPSPTPDVLTPAFSSLCDQLDFKIAVQASPPAGAMAAFILTEYDYINPGAWKIERIPFYEAASMEQVKLVMCIRASAQTTGKYSDGSSANKVIWDVRLVRPDDKKVVASSQFSGGSPSSLKSFNGPAYGPTPSNDMLRWLYPLLGDTSILTSQSYINSLAFRPDGKALASSDTLDNVNLWDLTSRKLLRTTPNLGQEIAFSADGKLLAAGGRNEYVIRLVDAASGQILRTLSKHANSICELVFSPDGKKIASSSNDKSVKLWDVTSGQLLFTLSSHTDYVCVLAFSPDGKLLVSGGRDGNVILWSVDKGEQQLSLSIAKVITKITFLPNGGMLILDSGANATIWDTLTRGLQHSFSLAGQYNITAAAVSLDGSILATGNAQGEVNLWSIDTGAELQRLTGHTTMITDLAFSPDGKLLVSASLDKTTKLWDLEKIMTK